MSSRANRNRHASDWNDKSRILYIVIATGFKANRNVLRATDLTKADALIA